MESSTIASKTYGKDFAPRENSNLQSTFKTRTRNPPICEQASFSIQSPFSQICFKNFANKNPSLQANFTASTLNFGSGKGKIYKSVQIHFHVPSEHTINGRHYDAEFHIVHKANDGQLAVYGLLLHGTRRIRYDFLSSLNPRSLKNSMVKLPAFSTPSTVYHYKGSLTTPNCDEGVQWFVNSQPILISAKSLASLRSLINGGHGDGISRKTQPLNGRRIIKVGTGCKLFCK